MSRCYPCKVVGMVFPAEGTACAKFWQQEKPLCFLGTDCSAILFYFIDFQVSAGHVCGDIALSFRSSWGALSVIFLVIIVEAHAVYSHINVHRISQSF